MEPNSVTSSNIDLQLHWCAGLWRYEALRLYVHTECVLYAGTGMNNSSVALFSARCFQLYSFFEIWKLWVLWRKAHNVSVQREREREKGRANEKNNNKCMDSVVCSLKSASNTGLSLSSSDVQTRCASVACALALVQGYLHTYTTSKCAYSLIPKHTTGQCVPIRIPFN